MKEKETPIGLDRKIKGDFRNCCRCDELKPKENVSIISRNRNAYQCKDSEACRKVCWDKFNKVKKACDECGAKWIQTPLCDSCKKS